jgi:hypothetical protein
MRTEPNREPPTPSDAWIPSAWTPAEVEQLVVHTRLELYNRGVCCGPRAVRERMKEAYEVRPPPSERTIARMLARNGLTYGRTGWYQVEGPPIGPGNEPIAIEPAEGGKRHP